MVRERPRYLPVAAQSGLRAREPGGNPPFDFSSLVNGCGPCRLLLDTLSAVDASRDSDGDQPQLRAALAALHDVDPARIVLASSAGEFIYRMTARIAREGGLLVSVPAHSYGDYTSAASAWGLRVHRRPVVSMNGPQSRWFQSADIDLIWVCEPSALLGVGEPLLEHRAPIVVDASYQPLRLSGPSAWTGEHLDRVWRLYSPRHALGLPGVGGAYAIAASGDVRRAAALQRMAPPGVLGAYSVAMLSAWTQSPAQSWLAASRSLLSDWKRTQIAMLRSFGWRCLPSDTAYFCAVPPEYHAPDGLSALLADLRGRGIQLQDARGVGLEGHVRLSVQAPLVQRALETALQQRVSGVW